MRSCLFKGVSPKAVFGLILALYVFFKLNVTPDAVSEVVPHSFRSVAVCGFQDHKCILSKWLDDFVGVVAEEHNEVELRMTLIRVLTLRGPGSTTLQDFLEAPLERVWMRSEERRVGKECRL